MPPLCLFLGVQYVCAITEVVSIERKAPVLTADGVLHPIASSSVPEEPLYMMWNSGKGTVQSGWTLHARSSTTANNNIVIQQVAPVQVKLAQTAGKQLGSPTLEAKIEKSAQCWSYMGQIYHHDCLVQTADRVGHGLLDVAWDLESLELMRSHGSRKNFVISCGPNTSGHIMKHFGEDADVHIITAWWLLGCTPDGAFRKLPALSLFLLASMPSFVLLLPADQLSSLLSSRLFCLCPLALFFACR